MAAAKRIIPEHTTRTFVSLADLVGERRELAVPFPGGAELTLTYDPTRVTSRLVTFDPDNPDRDAIAKAICRVVRDWDLAECPEVGPGHEDTVAEVVPVEVLGYVLKAINEDNALNPRTAPPTTR